MSDSDETVCDDGETQAIPNQSQISPSILRKDSSDHGGPADNAKTPNSGGSPEFLPPSAKIQKLTKENAGELVEGKPVKSSIKLSQERQSEQVESTFSTEKPATERLKLIKGKEDEIEKLLGILESKGTSVRNSPVFAQVKLLMTQVKTQLAEFTRCQQEQRKQIAESQESQDTFDSQWTKETKEKILDLASQQKELLKLFHCHKKLLEKIQELKQKEKSGTKQILPAVEMHHKSQGMISTLKEAQSENAKQPSTTNVTVTNLSQSGSITSDVHMPINESEKIWKNSKLTTTASSFKHVSSGVTDLQNQSNSYQVSSTASQVVPSCGKTLSDSGLSNHIPVLATQNISSVTLSATPQPKAQNVVLTAEQLYQVGNRQVFVLPQGLKTNVTASLPAPQVSQPQQGPQTMIPQNTMACVATGVPLPQPSTVLAITAPGNSTQSCSLNTFSNSGSQVQDQMVQSFSQVSSCSTKAPNTGVTLHVSRNATASKSCTSALSTPTDDLLNAYAALHKNTISSVTAQFGNHVSKQTTQTVNPLATTRENNIAPLMQKSSRSQSQSQYTKSSQSTVQLSSIQSAKTTPSVTSRVSTAESRSSGQILQRRNSLGSELLDVKSLLNHNIIEPGSNVLSIQLEGRKFEASLRANGLIESAGGETFRTPMAWMRAVTGSWTTVKQSQAYKMVHYKGTPLDSFTISSADKDNCEYRAQPCNPTVSDKALDGHDKTGKLTGLITSWDDVAQLLTDCRVVPVSSNELFPVESFLPANFWDSSEVDIPPSVLAELDF